MNNAFLLLCKIFFIFLIFHGKIAFSAQIHYFVLKEDAVGALSIESHQIIDANEKLEGLSLNKPQASRLKSYKQSRETNVEFGAVAIKQIPDLSQKLVLGPGLE